MCGVIFNTAPIRRPGAGASVLAAALALSLSLAATGPASAKEAGAAPAPMRIYFLGNSYTFFNNLPRLVQALAQKDGYPPISYLMYAPGAAALRKSWAAADRPPLQPGAWDVMVIQEQSLLAVAPLRVNGRVEPVIADVAPFLDTIAGIAQAARAAGARPLLYMTWARADDDGRFAAHLRQAYTAAGRRTGAPVAPVGMVWSDLRARYPGWVLNQPDGSHPTPLGSFVAACTLHVVLHGLAAHCRAGPIAGVPVAIDGKPLEVAGDGLRSSADQVTLADVGQREAAAIDAAVHRAIARENADLATPAAERGK